MRLPAASSALRLAAWLSLGVACAPLDERSEGSLEVRFQGLGPTRVQIACTLLSAEVSRAFTLVPSGGEARLFVESLPAGRTRVESSALDGGGAAPLRRNDEVMVVAGSEASFVIDFGELIAVDAGVSPDAGGTDLGSGEDLSVPLPITSDPIRYDFAAVDASELRGDDLAATTEGGIADFLAFVEEARSRLAREPAALRVVSGELELVAASGPVVGISDLFPSADILVLADGGTDVVVGRISADDSARATLVPAGDQRALDLLGSEITTGMFQLRVRGLSPRRSGEDFSASLRARISFSLE